MIWLKWFLMIVFARQKLEMSSVACSDGRLEKDEWEGACKDWMAPFWSLLQESCKLGLYTRTLFLRHDFMGLKMASCCLNFVLGEVGLGISVFSKTIYWVLLVRSESCKRWSSIQCNFTPHINQRQLSHQRAFIKVFAFHTATQSPNDKNTLSCRTGFREDNNNDDVSTQQIQLNPPNPCLTALGQDSNKEAKYHCV